jgi:hypothetical protein
MTCGGSICNLEWKLSCPIPSQERSAHQKPKRVSGVHGGFEWEENLKERMLGSSSHHATAQQQALQ